MNALQTLAGNQRTIKGSSASGTSRWVAWFTGMIAIASAVFAIDWLFGYSDGIVWVIVGLFLLSLAKSFLDIQFLDEQTKRASEQVRELSKLNDLGAFVQQARPSLFRTHIASLHKIFLSDARIDQDSLIEVVHARLLARNKVVELFASILITLGLIGTIVGLIGAQGGLEKVLADSGGDTDQLFVGMRETISGLGTAFFTTLFGSIFGGIILRILTSVVDSAILQYMAHLSELTVVHVLPALRRTAGRLEAEGYYRRLDATPA